MDNVSGLDGFGKKMNEVCLVTLHKNAVNAALGAGDFHSWLAS